MMRQNKKVTNIGMRSFLLDFHISFTTSYSIMYITAQMITADNEAEKEDNNYAKLAFFCMLPLKCFTTFWNEIEIWRE